MIDQDSDGFIDAADLQAMLTTLGKPPTKAQVDRLLENAPKTNGRTGINFTQFLTSM
jgi:Ca2+-binding EF-hand superfamily protein